MCVTFEKIPTLNKVDNIVANGQENGMFEKIWDPLKNNMFILKRPL